MEALPSPVVGTDNVVAVPLHIGFPAELVIAPGALGGVFTVMVTLARPVALAAPSQNSSLSIDTKYSVVWVGDTDAGLVTFVVPLTVVYQRNMTWSSPGALTKVFKLIELPRQMVALFAIKSFTVESGVTVMVPVSVLLVPQRFVAVTLTVPPVVPGIIVKEGVEEVRGVVFVMEPDIVHV